MGVSAGYVNFIMYVIDHYGDPLPLEYVMRVPAHISQQRLLQVSESIMLLLGSIGV